MKKWALLVSGIVEVTGAIIIYFNPEMIFQDDIPIQMIYRLYAITMLIVGLICLLTARHYLDNQLTSHIFLTIMFFHAVITTMLYTADNSEVIQPTQSSITHGILFIMFLFAYLSDVKKVESA